MKDFEIIVEWQMTTTMNFSANSLEEAKEMARTAYGLPDDGTYIPDSFQVDEEATNSRNGGDDWQNMLIEKINTIIADYGNITDIFNICFGDYQIVQINEQDVDAVKYETEDDAEHFTSYAFTELDDDTLQEVFDEVEQHKVECDKAIELECDKAIERCLVFNLDWTCPECGDQNWTECPEDTVQCTWCEAEIKTTQVSE